MIHCNSNYNASMFPTETLQTRKLKENPELNYDLFNVT